MIDPSEFSFFLDSGAFSAWSKGAQIDLDTYCAFIHANIEHIEAYANLDVIPGEPGRDATPQEREAAARASWVNYEYMRADGLSPVPVFHVGEDWGWLERMMASTDYIGLGGMVGSHLTRELRREWLDAAFDRICNADGRPKVRVHGFGMTAIPLIFRYPWHSVDSTSWIKATMSGVVLLPATNATGSFVFDRAPMPVAVSDAAGRQQQLSPTMRQIVDRWLAECGKTYEEVASHYYHRAVCNVIYFKRVSEEKASRPFHRNAKRRQGLL